MSNVTNNRLNLVLDDNSMQKIKDAITNIINLLPQATLLDEDRAGGYSSISVDNKVFVENVHTEVNISGANVLPAYIDISLLKNDLTLYQQMDSIGQALEDLQQRVSDIGRIGSHEAFGFANTIYGLYDIANKAGVPGAKQGYETMRERYSNQGGTRKPDPVS